MKIIKFTSQNKNKEKDIILKDSVSFEIYHGALPHKLSSAIGTFDGVHVGHRRLICGAVLSAAESAGNVTESAVLTFSGIRKNDLIMTEEDRLLTIGSLGADFAVVYDFDSIRDTSPKDFVMSSDGLVKCSELHCGYNFRFGKNAEGDTKLLGELLKKLGTSISVLEPVSLLGKAVSSTRIRTLLKDGDIPAANLLLGEAYSLKLPVMSGYRLGRTLGFPTANQYLPPELLCPRKGVYAAETVINGRIYPVVCNIGNRPTVSEKDEISVESHIIGYNGDLYGRELRVSFYKFLRDEVKFSSKEELSAQIQRDKKMTIEFFSRGSSRQ